MNQEEKANDLIHKFRVKLMDSNSDFGEEIIVSVLSQKFALFCINEIIESSPSLPILSDDGIYGSDIQESLVYWQGVKKHLLKL